MTTGHSRIYWHRDLPPLDAELMGEHSVDAVSESVAYRFDERDELWQRCSASLRERLAERLEAEIDRLGGDYVHVLEEDVTPHVDHPTGKYWLIGRVRYTLYRRAPGR
jgi:hypothetical protein